MPFQEGDRVYIVENNLRATPCTICSTSGDMCVIRFDKGGVIRVRAGRLFRTAEETGRPVTGTITSAAPETKKKPAKPKEKTPWDWA